MYKRPLVLPTLTLLTLSITSHFALADRNKGKVPIVTPECSDIAVCKQQAYLQLQMHQPTALQLSRVSGCLSLITPTPITAI